MNLLIDCKISTKVQKVNQIIVKKNAKLFRMAFYYLIIAALQIQIKWHKHLNSFSVIALLLIF